MVKFTEIDDNDEARRWCEKNEILKDLDKEAHRGAFGHNRGILCGIPIARPGMLAFVIRFCGYEVASENGYHVFLVEFDHVGELFEAAAMMSKVTARIRDMFPIHLGEPKMPTI